jgi:hypothetical protein
LIEGAEVLPPQQFGFVNSCMPVGRSFSKPFWQRTGHHDVQLGAKLVAAISASEGTGSISAQAAAGNFSSGFGTP